MFLGSGDDGERRLRGGRVKASDGMVLICVISIQGWSLEVQSMAVGFAYYAAGFSSELQW